MATNEVIRKVFQSGNESTRGTAVAATRKMYADLNYSYDRPIQEFMDRSGTYFGRRRVAYQRPNIGFSGTDLLTFEDFPYWLNLGIGGASPAPTPTIIAGTPTAGQSRKWSPHATTDNLHSWTVEFNESGNPYEASQFMLNSWTVRIDPDNEGGWMLDFEGFARDWSTTTFTGSPASDDRTTEVIRAPGTLVYINDAHASIGTTQVVGKIIDFSMTCNLNLHMKAFMEDDLSWSPNKVGRGLRTFDIVMTMEFDSDTEFAKYRATTATERVIQIKRSGSQLNTVPTNKLAQIDAYGYWRSIGFGDREGNLTATMGLQCFYNATAGYDVAVTVINGLTNVQMP